MTTPAQTHPSAISTWRDARRRLRASLLRPPPRLTIAEWADRNRVVPPGTSPEPGPWRTDRVPYLRGIMDALSDRRVERVVAMLASQTGKTEVALNAIGYFIDQEPSPILVIQPSEKPMGEAFSKDRLAPMLAASPSLRDKVRPARVKDSGNQVLHKVFPGGYVSIAGANSAAGLASRPIRVLLCDEVDRYPASAGNEGDPVTLGIQRTANFTWTRKVYLVSTPTRKGESRIEKEWKRSDQRRYHVPCPDCGHRQHLQWGGPNSSTGLKWERIPAAEAGPVESGDIVRNGIVHRTKTAAYLCESCGVLIREDRKGWMLKQGEWRATAVGQFPGFHLNALYSPWVTWPSLVAAWLDAQDDTMQLQTFVNTKLAETFEEKAERLDAGALEGRAEQWDADVPDGVGVLTAAIDVQGDRLELLVRGWGVNEESWDVLHERIHGDPESVDTWARASALLTKAYRHASGAELRVRRAMIDARYKMDAVHRFCRPLYPMAVPSVGDGGEEGTAPLRRAMRSRQGGVKNATLGVFALKETVLRRLQITRAGPRYVHLRRADATRCNGFDAEFFAQFGAEKIVTEIVKGARRPRRKFHQTRTRNEALDLHAYNLAALMDLGAGLREIMPQLVEQARVGPAELTAVAEAATPTVRAEDPDWSTGGGRWGNW